jgi:F420H(2)-dependent quinone reductase
VTTTGDRLLTAVQRRTARLHTGLIRRSGGRLGNRFRGGEVVLLTHR